MSLVTDNYQWDIQYTGGTPQTGTFLDGTPWIYPNGATLVLVGVSPGQTLAAPEIQNYGFVSGYSGVTLPVGGTYPAGTYQTSSGVTLPGATGIVNQTIINPHYGKIKRDAAYSGASYDYGTFDENVNCVTGQVVTGNQPTNYDLLFDFRMGTQDDKPELTVGRYFDSSQGVTQSNNDGVINPGVTLEAGDMIVTQTAYTGVMGNSPIWTGGGAEVCWTQSWGVCTVVGSVPPANAFRPPVNWDPTDKANRPILTEVDDLSGHIVSYPNYNFTEDTKTWTETKICQEELDNDTYLGDPKNRAGTLNLVPMWNDNSKLRGTMKAQSTSYREYGGWEAIQDEARMISAFDPGVSAEDRTAFRRVMTQKGIDVGMASYSLGKLFKNNGYHGGEWNPKIIFAYLVTQDSRLFDVLDFKFGNTSNETYKEISKTGPAGKKLLRGYHETEQSQKGGPICSWRHYNVKVTESGVSGGTAYIVIDRPIDSSANNLVYFNQDGSTYEGPGTNPITGDDGNVYNGPGITSDRPVAYHIRATDELGLSPASRWWGLSSNQRKIKDTYFISAYVRTKGPSGGISRVVWTDSTIAAPGYVGSWNPIEGKTGTQATWEQNPDSIKLWLQTDIVGGGPNGITQADLCNGLEETRPNTHYRTITYNEKNTATEAGDYAYTYSVLSHLLSNTLTCKAIENAGITLPAWGEFVKDRSTFYAGTDAGKNALVHWANAGYNIVNDASGNSCNTQGLYYAMLRQECAAGVSLAPAVLENTEGEDINAGGVVSDWGKARFLDTSRWYDLPASPTWEELQGITGASGGVTCVARSSNGTYAHYRIGSGQQLESPSWTRWYYTSTDGAPNFQTLGTGPTGELVIKNCPNEWSNYDGPVYAWCPGATFAYGLTMTFTSASSGTDTNWNAAWKLIDETVSPFNMIGPYLGGDNEFPAPNIIWTRSADQ